MDSSQLESGAFSPDEGYSGAITENVQRKVVQVDRTSTRVKTRFLRFKSEVRSQSKKPIDTAVRPIEPAGHECPIGRLEIIEGEGRGRKFALKSGVYHVGRADGQDIQLAFGDNSVSRSSHAIISHYRKGAPYVIRDGMKPNPVFLNGRLVRGDVNLNDGDIIRIGETTLLFTE